MNPVLRYAKVRGITAAHMIFKNKEVQNFVEKIKTYTGGIIQSYEHFEICGRLVRPSQGGERSAGWVNRCDCRVVNLFYLEFEKKPKKQKESAL